MKLTIILLIATLQVSANAFSQQISLHFNRASLQEVLTSIRKQSGYTFGIASSDLEKAKPVTLNLKSTDIDEILQAVFADQPFEYQIQHNIIMIKLKESKKKIETASSKKDQTTDLIGRITDTMGRFIPDANVSIVGTNKRTTTDGTGAYLFKGAPSSGRLLVTMVGYESQTVNYSGSPVDVRLKVSISSLDEVRVIAYGITSKRLTTGNSGGITAKEIETQPVSNPLLTLAGRTPGITVTQTSGMPGGGVTIRIQGVNSIGRGNDPFYVVDGVPYIQQVLPTLGSNVLGQSGDTYAFKNAGSGNPFSYINPADIESIEVLKDADATAIYGSRAANGAILITTKRGKTGASKIDATFQTGISKVAHKMNLLNTQEYLEMRKEAYKNDGIPLPTSPDWDNYDLTVWDQNKNTDWQKELLGGNAHYTDAQVSISGGSGTTTFRFNAGYHKETTVLSENFSDRKGSFGLAINHNSLQNRFKLQFTANYLMDDNQLPTSDITNMAITLAPNAPALSHPDGSINWQRILSGNGVDSLSTFNVNPLSYLVQKYQNKTNNLVSSFNLSYNILKGLDLRSNFGYTSTTSDEVTIFPSTALPPEIQNSDYRMGSYANGSISSWIIEPQLNYTHSISGGKFDFLLGGTLQSRQHNLRGMDGMGYNNDAVIYNYQAAATLTAREPFQATYKYSAAFARLNYNWQDKYIINITARRDGSSRFGLQSQMHNFGAVGAAWLFSSETFAKQMLPSLSFGKLRASYGTTGNDQIGDYGYLNLYNNYNVPVPYQGITTIKPNKLLNPYLEWELTKKLQVGLDLGFINDRLLFSTNYFNNRSDNQLVNYALPVMTGFSNIERNFPATVENSGWEFSLNTINLKTKDFSWNSSINLTISSNKLIAFPGIETSTYANSLVVGKSVKLTRNYKFAGVDPTTGIYQFYAADKSIVTTPNSVTDKTYLIDRLPKYFGGFQNSFSYKGFQLDALFQFVKQQALGYEHGFGAVGVSNFNQPVSVLQRWQKDGDRTIIQKYSMNLPASDVQSSDAAYTDASFIRLKNVSLSWSLPKGWISRMHLQNFRLFLHGQNLLTITKYDGLDPETLNLNSLPPLRVWSFGVNATL
ncbi:TonB-dependent receptor [Chitinophaga oryziterrae]